MNLLRKLAVAVVAMGSVSVAQADLIHYDEAISGDLQNGLPYDQTFNIGTLGIGLNTVTGNTSGLPGVPENDHSDAFNFNIADGMSLVSVTLEYSNVVGLNQATMFLRKIDDPTIPTQFWRDSVLIFFEDSISPFDSFSAFLPTGEGLYQINTPGNFGSYDSPPPNMDYRWTLEVNAVPEPETPLRCDTNDDGTVDIYDIRFISANRNQLATGPDDPMDWDENGVIDILDARGCQQACTFPRCAAQ